MLLDDEGLMDTDRGIWLWASLCILTGWAMSAAGVEAGLPETCKRASKATVCGAGALMAEVETPPAVLRENVTSKGGMRQHYR